MRTSRSSRPICKPGYKIFRHEKVSEPLRQVVEKAWSLLPPSGVPEQGLPPLDKLNFFDPTEKWIEGRYKKIREVSDALGAVLNGDPLPGKVIAGRYAPGLVSVHPASVARLKKVLDLYLSPTGELT